MRNIFRVNKEAETEPEISTGDFLLVTDSEKLKQLASVSKDPNTGKTDLTYMSEDKERGNVNFAGLTFTLTDNQHKDMVAKLGELLGENCIIAKG